LTGIILLAAVVVRAFTGGPAVQGCASGPWAWSEGPAECLYAPAGIVRMTGFACSAFSSFDNGERDGLTVVGAGKILGGHYMASTMLLRGERSDTMAVSLGTARTLKGNPVGFMDGVFGPSITVGGKLEYLSPTDARGDGMLSLTAGMQFSVFPTIALGVNVSGLRLAGENLAGRRVDYGFTTIFDRRFRGHFSVNAGRPAVGFELEVKEWLKTRTGSDGTSWNSGISLLLPWGVLEWGLGLGNTRVVQVAGIRFPGEEGW